MKILAIETSCDETAVAVLEAEGEVENPRFKVLGNALLSQAMKHREYGGVYPTLAKREHAKNLVPLLKKALKDAKILELGNKNYSGVLENIRIVLGREHGLLEQFLEFIPTIEKPDVDIITVTQGPGLEPALWVGLNFAKALSMVWDIPLVPVNHMEGHVLAPLANKESRIMNYEETLEFPAIALLVSGGHTQLVFMKDWLKYEIVGETRDDAAGEAFDKVARMLELPYPGGPEISKLAEKSRKLSGRTTKFVELPRPMIDSPDLDFSFSGLKTAVLYRVKEIPELTPELMAELAREFEDAVIDVLIKKTGRAIKKYDAKTLILGGGVVANKELRRRFEGLEDINLIVSDIELSGDNAIMIGIAGYLNYQKNESAYKIFGEDTAPIRANGNLPISA